MKNTANGSLVLQVFGETFFQTQGVLSPPPTFLKKLRVPDPGLKKYMFVFESLKELQYLYGGTFFYESSHDILCRNIWSLC